MQARAAMAVNGPAPAFERFWHFWSNHFTVSPTNNNINNAGTDAVSSDNNNSSSNNNLTKLLTLSTGLPKLDENVTCVGFPQGGTQISVTRGVVSRIDVDSQYVLRIQIDAAINPGNSGGVSGHCKKLCLLSDCVSVVSNYLYLKW